MLSWVFGSRNGSDGENDIDIEEKLEIEDFRRTIDTLKLTDNLQQNLNEFTKIDADVFIQLRASMTSQRGLAVVNLLMKLSIEVGSFEKTIRGFCMAVVPNTTLFQLNRAQIDQFLDIGSTEDTYERWERLGKFASCMTTEAIPRMAEELISSKKELVIALNRGAELAGDSATSARELAEQCRKNIELTREHQKVLFEMGEQAKKLTTAIRESKVWDEAHKQTLKNLTTSVNKCRDLESKLKAAQKEAAAKLKAAEEHAQIELQRIRKEFNDGPIENPRYLKFKHAQLLKDHNAEVRKGENLERAIEKLKGDNEAFLMKVTTGQAEVDSAAADNKELVRLRGEVRAMHNLKVECDRLKELVKDSHVKQVEEQLRRARSEVNELRVMLKEKRAPDPKSTRPSGIAGTEGITSNEPETVAKGEKCFPKASATTLYRVRSKLAALNQQVKGLSDNQVGMGWGIVERAEGLVRASTLAMVNEIDSCLALRDEVGLGRLQDLDRTGFPALKTTLDTTAGAGGAGAGGGEGASRFSVLAGKDEKEGKTNGAATQTPKVLKVVVNPSGASSSKLNRHKSKA